ncbi:MAG: PQQ-binding-like beta-propeller repeat protein [Verrucomicrobia bacterium]|nr:PQQ-binding-like beta-propeller repeat protein [Verrucomicrobiota bacterium]
MALPAAAGSWTAWRGDGTGQSPEQNFPTEWSDTKNVRWKVPVPGYGWSCPVIAGDKIFLTTAITEKQQAPLRKGPGGGEDAPDVMYRWEVHCYDRATGKLLWNQKAAEHKPRSGNHLSNTFASETPVTDGERVYAYIGQVGVFCYDLNGKLLWSHDLGAYRTQGNWGTSSSPALEGGRLFVLCDNAEKSFLVAFDAKSGKELWRVSRSEGTTWSSPIIWRDTARTELVVMGSGYNRGYDLASGNELWRCASERSVSGGGGGSFGVPPSGGPRSGGPGGPPPSGGKSKGPPPGEKSGDAKSKGKGGDTKAKSGKTGSGGCKASPVATAEMLYVGMSPKITATELGPLWAIKPGASGDISLKPGETNNAFVAWFRMDAGPHFTSSVVVDGRLYTFPPHDRGVLSCFDAKTGATIFQEPLPGASAFKASPCAFDGKIFCTDEGGTAFVIEAGPKFKLLAKNRLDEMTWSSPALVGGAIYLRTVSHLLCIGGENFSADPTTKKP